MPKKYFFPILLPFLLAVTGSAGQSLSETDFTRYTSRDGLSDNNVTGIAQDAVGYIWLATSSGLNRYDGSRFIQYHSTNDSLSPAAEGFSKISRLDKDRIAFLPTGLHIINTRNGERKNIFIPYHDKQFQYKFNMAERASGDANGNTYVLTRSGFYHFDKNYDLLFRFDYFAEKDVPTLHFFFGNDLIELDDQRLLIAARPGLFMYDKGKRKFSKLVPGDIPLLDEFIRHNTYFKFFQVNQGRLLITKADTDSIYYIDIKSGQKHISRTSFPLSTGIIQWRSKLIQVSDTLFYVTGQTSGFYALILNPASGSVHFRAEKYFGDYLCNDILADRENHIWVATNNGLFREDDIRRLVQTAAIPDALTTKFPNLSLTSVFVTGNKIYAGARAGAGLLVFDKKTLQYEKNWIIPTAQKGNSIFKIISPFPSAFMTASSGPLSMYNETNGAITSMNPPSWSSEDWTNELFKDSRGDIWISSGNIYRYNPVTNKFTIIPFNQSMPSSPVSIAEDRNGNIWMAGHGIIRYNISSGRFDEKIDSFPFIKMPDKQVGPLAVDRHNNLWFGSTNNGLIGYNIDTKTFRHFTTSNGLPGNDISALIVVGNKLWVGCYSGLACLDLTSSRLISFEKDKGFPEMPLYNRAGFFYDSIAKQLYIGFANALVRFNPDELLTQANKPSVFIESLKINDRNNFFLPGNIIQTPWRQNDILLSIGSVNFTDGRSQGYAYRILKKDDSPWQPLNNQHTFSISNLAPGKHRIQVKVFSLNNSWPEQVKEITVEVLPPFWMKTWFRILSVAVLLILVFLFIQWRTAAARKKEMEKTQVEKLKTADYKNRYELEQISNYFSSSLADKKTEDEVLWDVAGNLIGRMNYVDCMIYLWNEDKTKMVQKAAYGPKGKPEFIAQHVFDVLPGQGVVGHVMQTMQPLLISDTRTDSRYRVDEAFRLSEICVPIIHNNELLGIIDSEHHEADYFTERDSKILTTIATLIGNKLKQLQSEQTLQVKQQELTNINEQLAEAKLSALQAQMNPHFVFNALNSIKRMILENENEKASRYLSKFALMIRMTLNHSKDVFVTLQENIEYLQTYLEMEQLRFDDSFSWKITSAENIDTEETPVPSLMIQPLVENAIWHGLMQSEGDKQLSITFSRNEKIITCSIEDNGIGILRSEEQKKQQQAVHRSVGLENLRNRINILNEKYNTGCTLSITDLRAISGNGQGTRAVLSYNMI